MLVHRAKQSSSLAALAAAKSHPLTVTGKRALSFDQITNGSTAFARKVQKLFAHDVHIPKNYANTAAFKQLTSPEQRLFIELQRHLPRDTTMGDLMIRAHYAGQNMAALLEGKHGPLTAAQLNQALSQQAKTQTGPNHFKLQDFVSMWNFLQAA